LIAGGALVDLAVRLASPDRPGFDELSTDLGAGLFVVVGASLGLIFFLTVILGCGGILLEALVKSFRGRPASVDKALALYKKSRRKRSPFSKRSKQRRQRKSPTNPNTSSFEYKTRGGNLTSDQQNIPMSPDGDINS
jgi:hypothetical protein